MSGEYTFFSRGFFGFGPAGTFRAYSLMHFIPILICIGLVLLVWHMQDSLRSWEGESHLRFVMAFIMFVTEFSYFLWILYVGDISGNYHMMSNMPLHACDLGMITCMFMVPSKNRTLFGINFFVTLFGATLACIIPQTVLDSVGPMHFRYYQFFMEHLFPIFATIYMMIVHRMQPRYRDIWISAAVLAAMAPASIMLNDRFPGSDYLFLKLEMPFFPADQITRAALFTVLLILIFHLMWFIWEMASGGKLRRSRAKAA